MSSMRGEAAETLRRLRTATKVVLLDVRVRIHPQTGCIRVQAALIEMEKLTASTSVVRKRNHLRSS